MVLLRPREPGDDEDEDEEGGSPRAVSPCCVRFLNDNVLINGRSSLTTRAPARDRLAKVPPPHRTVSPGLT